METDYSSQKIKQLYSQHSDDIYRFILFIVGDSSLAEDLTHDTFLGAYKNMKNFEGRSTEKTWLYRIARNVAIDSIRKKKSVKWLFQSLTSSISSIEPLPQEVIVWEENEQELYRALRKLKRSYQLAIYFRKIKELTLEETAHILDCKESKVKTDVYRGLQILKKQLVEEGYTHESI